MSITANDVIAKVRELASASPTFVYTPVQVPSFDGYSSYDACRYVAEDGESGDCIFGQSLIALDVPAEDLQSCEGGEVSMVLDFLDIDYSDDQRYWSAKVQSEQDRGTEWGKAVAIADKAYSAV